MDCNAQYVDAFYKRISYPFASKEYWDAWGEEEDIGTRKHVLLMKLFALTDKTDPKRNRTKEGIVLQQVSDIDDEMIELMYDFDYKHDAQPLKHNNDPEWSISEHKRLHKKHDSVISEYLESVNFPSREPHDEVSKTEATDNTAKATDTSPSERYRRWTSAKGKHTRDAKIVSYTNGIVTLEDTEGKQIKVEKDKLSQPDRDFIDKWRRELR